MVVPGLVSLLDLDEHIFIEIVDRLVETCILTDLLWEVFVNIVDKVVERHKLHQ